MAENSIRREGRVKRIEYLDYLVKKRAEEEEARRYGHRVTSMSIDEIRAEFEQKYGSIYINI